MFKALRRHANPATLIALVALVFAMSGGAYAITSKGGGGPSASIAAKQKGKKTTSSGKPGPRGPKGEAGPAGKEGAAGKEGPAGKEGKPGEPGKNGEPGKAGEPGKNGEPGKAGESVAMSQVPTGVATCEEQGGEKLTQASGSATICNGEPGPPGKEGSPWTDKSVLPAGATETGTWSFYYSPAKAEEVRYVPISFPIQLAKPLEGNPLDPNGCPNGSSCFIHIVAPETTGKGPCEGGTVEEPKAASGNLCIYEGFITPTMNAGPYFFTPGREFGSTGVSGVLWRIVLGETVGAEEEGSGSWAVTG
jgi:hypothetical protein